MITCPVVPTSPTEESESYATVSWNEPSISDGTITDNSGSATPMFLGPGINGGNFEIGTNVLAYMVTDEAGNSNNCSFMIVVIGKRKNKKSTLLFVCLLLFFVWGMGGGGEYTVMTSKMCTSLITLTYSVLYTYVCLMTVVTWLFLCDIWYNYDISSTV